MIPKVMSKVKVAHKKIKTVVPSIIIKNFKWIKYHLLTNQMMMLWDSLKKKYFLDYLG